jgi:hypothetical protein
MTEGLWTIIGVLIGSVSAGTLNLIQQSKQFKNDTRFFELQNKSKEVIKDILRDALNHKSHCIRSFDTLRKRVSGYNDKELTQLLFEIEVKKGELLDGSEGYYLIERELEYYEYNKKKLINK